MQTKHSRSEMNSLAVMVASMAHEWPADDLDDRLIKCTLQRLAIAFNKNVVEVKREYKIKWKTEHALAFAIAVHEGYVNGGPFEINLGNQLTNTIIQQTTIINV